jgi:hypothetical protein
MPFFSKKGTAGGTHPPHPADKLQFFDDLQKNIQGGIL